ncbi:serine/threonine-protein kinase [Arthrobacter sp. KBS0703]|uniref:serine/threonine-protein kinase n=1 Tax=Arthrobacter sp. KBS0703 TaxID=1955698 RepID=UPI0009D09B3F|nr:serine/threonine-protein kinase [Arthrobacter sp. KBS0703]
MDEGQILGSRFRLISKLGEGGMGEVWLARDERLNRDVAIKGLGQSPEPGHQRRLEMEAHTVAGLDHPRIVPIFDTFTEDGRLYLVMRYVPGRDLGKATALTASAKVNILTEVLEALAYLHDEADVTHRDLKPSNILLDQRQQAFVADFGIARSHRDPEATKTAGIIGSPQFMAPEVRAGQEATKLSDVWSFGAVALWLFSGRSPDAGIPDGQFAGTLTDQVRVALSNQRPTAAALLEAFQHVRQTGGLGPLTTDTATLTRTVETPAPAAAQPAQRRRWIPAAVAAAMVVLAAVLAIALLRPGNTSPPPQTQPSISDTPSETPSSSPTDTLTETPTPTATETSETPTPSETTPTAAPAAGPTWYYLADMQPIETEIESLSCTGGCANFLPGPAVIAGDVYPQSYMMRMLSGGQRSTSLWNAYTKCTTFEATIGMDDSSASVTAKFLLEREGGKTEQLGVLNTGKPRSVKVDLKGVFRFKLVAYLAKVDPQKRTDQKAAWGDARMLCSPLPTPAP